MRLQNKFIQCIGKALKCRVYTAADWFLFNHTLSDEDEQLWVWEYTTDEGGHDLFMDINEEIRFRVVDELFTDLSPAGPEMTGDMKNTDEVDSKRSPYSITVSPVIVFIIYIGTPLIQSPKGKKRWLY